MARWTRALAIIGSALLLAGCASTASTPQARAAVADDPAAVSKLVKGMTADAVRELLGKPAEVSLVATTDGMAEIWTFHRTFQTSRQVATSTRSLPAFVGVGPGDQQAMGTVQQPVYSVEIHEISETLKLLMFQDKLLEWKRTATDSRKYY